MVRVMPVLETDQYRQLLPVDSGRNTGQIKVTTVFTSKKDQPIPVTGGRGVLWPMAAIELPGVGGQLTSCPNHGDMMPP